VLGTGGGSYRGNGQCFFFPFTARDSRRKLQRERAVFVFSFCCQGQEEEVTQGTFFPFAARDRRRKLHREWVLKARPYVHVVGSV
jgi:hypothetical protein